MTFSYEVDRSYGVSLSRTTASLEDIQEVFREYEIESQQEVHHPQDTGTREEQLPFGEYSYYWFK